MLRVLSFVMLIAILISCEEPVSFTEVETPIFEDSSVVDTTEYFDVHSFFLGTQCAWYRTSFTIKNVTDISGVTTATIKEYSDNNVNHYWLVYGRQESICDSLILNYTNRVDLWYDSMYYEVDSIDVHIQINSLTVNKRIYDINSI